MAPKNVERRKACTQAPLKRRGNEMGGKPCGGSGMAAKRTMGRQGIDGLLCTATAAEVAGASVLNEDVDLISTEQMTELTAFKSIDRIVRYE